MKRCQGCQPLSSLLRFSQRFNNQPDLGRGEASGGFGETDGSQVFHQVWIVVDPKHQFLSGGCRGDVRAIELCQLAFAVSADMKHFFISNLRILPLTTNPFRSFIAPYRALSFRYTTQGDKCRLQGFAVDYLCTITGG